LIKCDIKLSPIYNENDDGGDDDDDDDDDVDVDVEEEEDFWENETKIFKVLNSLVWPI